MLQKWQMSNQPIFKRALTLFQMPKPLYMCKSLFLSNGFLCMSDYVVNSNIPLDTCRYSYQYRYFESLWTKNNIPSQMYWNPNEDKGYYSGLDPPNRRFDWSWVSLTYSPLPPHPPRLLCHDTPYHSTQLAKTRRWIHCLLALDYTLIGFVYLVLHWY